MLLAAVLCGCLETSNVGSTPTSACCKSRLVRAFDSSTKANVAFPTRCFVLDAVFPVLSDCSVDLDLTELHCMPVFRFCCQSLTEFNYNSRESRVSL